MCSLVANRSVNTVVNTLNVNRNVNTVANALNVNSCHKPLSALFTGHQLHANHTSRQQKMSEVDEEHLSELIPGYTGHCPLIFHLTNRGRLAWCTRVATDPHTSTHRCLHVCRWQGEQTNRETDKHTQGVYSALAHPDPGFFSHFCNHLLFAVGS